ncbi:hypothetical protein [Nocardia cerradoensis]|uniref:Uncharacterized protein n=1 Tax=Nocardia cerradoensis TaxID=85688 RepID=A0A231GW19_9NOCA|nr:hypothetical protein [Nocardia cerradoensis]OXR40819.1 hypothetical protein B7C42_07103 [Nocardia cerradoensis]
MLFDIRTIVGALLGCYGLILVVTSLVHDTAAERVRTGGWNINLWAGVGMLVAAAAFLLWVVLRPVRELTESEPEQSETDTPGGPGQP